MQQKSKHDHEPQDAGENKTPNEKEENRDVEKNPEAEVKEGDAKETDYLSVEPDGDGEQEKE